METWKQKLKQLKLDHIARTAPGFFHLSGGSSMSVKSFSDSTTTKLGNAVQCCLRYCGAETEIEQPYRIRKGLKGYRPVYNDFKQAVKISGKLDGKSFTIDVLPHASNQVKSYVDHLYLQTNCFEFFSGWFIQHFPKTGWAEISKPVCTAEKAGQLLDTQIIANNPIL